MEAEANQYIPFAIDEVNLDFQVIGPAPGNAAEIEILLAASRNVNVEDRVAVAQVAGLKVVVMDVEHYAAEMAFDQIRMQLPGGASRSMRSVGRYRCKRNECKYTAQRAIGVHARPANGWRSIDTTYSECIRLIR